MEEVFKEYGGAILSMMGTFFFLTMVGSHMFGSRGLLAQILKIWGLGGI